jgi:hypothetical protein
MKIPKLLRTTALGGALLAAVVACVRSAEASPADYGYGAPGYAPTFGFDAAYYLAVWGLVWPAQPVWRLLHLRPLLRVRRPPPMVTAVKARSVSL